jgi:predicted RND superfamily exporter protein
MASFGSMILARHQGLRTLGQVLSLGVFLCLTSSIVFFPALLSWLTRNRDEVAEEEASSAELDASPASSNNEMAAAA